MLLFPYICNNFIKNHGLVFLTLMVNTFYKTLQPEGTKKEP